MDTCKQHPGAVNNNDNSKQAPLDVLYTLPACRAAEEFASRPGSWTKTRRLAVIYTQHIAHDRTLFHLGLLLWGEIIVDVI